MTTDQQASIIHGYGATPDDHWFGWVAECLEAAGTPTKVPVLPDPEAPDPDRWLTVAGSVVGTPGRGSIVVAHSLGCITVLRHLRALGQPWHLGSLVLVSGFIDKLPALPVLDEYIGEGVDVAGLSEHIDRLTIIRSDADPYVPTGHTDRLARLLGTSSRVVPGAGHFLASDGVTSLSQVLDAIPGWSLDAS